MIDCVDKIQYRRWPAMGKLTGAVLIPTLFLISTVVSEEKLPAGQEKSGEEPVEIGSRLELFVDDHLVETMEGVAFRKHRPEKRPLSGFPDGGQYLTIIKDDDLYRLYYRIAEIYHYAESKDGIHWEKPDLDLVEGADGRRNAILAKRPFSHNFTPFLDTRPGVPDEERYKALAGDRRRPAGMEGLYAFGSADGIHWRKLSDQPVLVHNPDVHEWHAFDSQNAAFWSEAEQQYVVYFRHWNAQPGKLRTIGRAVSGNFLEWTDESADFEPPNLREDSEHLYTNQTHPYFRAPHLYIALPTRYVYGRIKGEPVRNEEDRLRNVGSTDIALMSSRAGTLSYDRTFKEAFMRPGLAEEGWENRANYVALNVVPTGPGEMSIYHRNGNRYVLRTDGFASVNAPHAGGEFTTKPLMFEGEELVLNVSTSISGSVRVELLSEEGEPLPGFSLQECDPIVDDSLERIVSWGDERDVGQYVGQPVRLRFVMRDADLYSFRFR